VRILVVEDDDDLRQSVAMPLKEAGHMVEVAADGLAADERIGEGGLDAVVLDFHEKAGACQAPRSRGR
jgi:DNA-binding response OmpR family regulator